MEKKAMAEIMEEELEQVAGGSSSGTVIYRYECRGRCGRYMDVSPSTHRDLMAYYGGKFDVKCACAGGRTVEYYFFNEITLE